MGNRGLSASHKVLFEIAKMGYFEAAVELQLSRRHPKT
jgi:hypothetical protein